MNAPLPVIGIIGGTGAEGSGLGIRWARAGYTVILGSRDGAKAEDTAHALAHGNISGADNAAAAGRADIAVLTVPFAAQRDTLAALKDVLQGKILVDVTVPLVPPRVARVQLPAEGSAAEIAQAALGEGVRVVSAFQSVSASHLADPTHAIDCDVLVSGDDAGARGEVIELCRAAGLRGLHAGPLANAAASEALTSVLIAMNRRYKVPGAGIRITGLPEDA